MILILQIAVGIIVAPFLLYLLMLTVNGLLSMFQQGAADLRKVKELKKTAHKANPGERTYQIKRAFLLIAAYLVGCFFLVWVCVLTGVLD